MNTTSLSLLDRLKCAGPDAAEWHRLKDVYGPLIRSWLSGVPGLREEAEDLAQDIFVVLVRGLPSFERRRHGSFRAWLRQITVNRVRAHWKVSRKQCHRTGEGDVPMLLSQLEDPASDLARQWDRDHDQHLLRKLLAVVRPDFDPKTWQAFTRFALDGLAAADVARELGTSESAVVRRRAGQVSRPQAVARRGR